MVENGIKKTKKFKVMISGYYGFGNIGDEAIITAITESLRKREPDISFTVLSSRPELTSKALNVNSIGRLNIFSIIKELLTTDLFISGGGGLMQDVTGPGSVTYYGGLITLAQMMNVPTMIYAQGIGPLNIGFNKKMVKNIFNKTTRITVRDSFSMQDLINMGIRENKIQVTADPVLLLEGVDKKHVNNILMGSGIDPHIPIIGISIRPWHSWYERQLKAFISVLYQLAKKYNFQILIIPFQHSSDLWLSREAEICFKTRPDSDVKINVLERPCSPKEMMGIIGAMTIVVGMRLHSLIMAAAQYIPSVGIAYDPKVAYFSSLAGFPCIPSVTELQSVDRLLETVESLIVNIDETKKALYNNVPRLTDLAMNNVNVALDILHKK